MPLAIAIAAVVAVAAALLWFKPWKGIRHVDDVAMLTFSLDAAWQIEGGTRMLGGATGVSPGSVLHLAQGRAGISLEPEVTAVIEGPAEVRFPSDATLHLEKGRGFFRRGGSGSGLTVSTPRLTAVDSGTEFGLEVPPGGPDEVHVMEGKVAVISKSAGKEVMLIAGDAARVAVGGAVESFPSDGRAFARGLGRFLQVFGSPFDPKGWRVEHGTPTVSEGRIEGANYAVFHPLPPSQPPGSGVLLVTIETVKPAAGEFHTDGWAGMSFFSKGTEVLFFGDSFGTKATWSLDVKQGIPVIFPENPVSGARTVTLRYDIRDGAVSLHDGGVPLKPPFCQGRLPTGTGFDEIRIGASSGAALTVTSLEIRAGGD
jgi:hypothetical protein